MNKSLLLIAVFVQALGMVSGVLVQWEVADGGNDHWYEKVDIRMDWDVAKLASEQSTLNGMPGHLATITSQAENDFILNAFSINGSTWIGGFQPSGSPEPNGDWQWVTGELWSFTNWLGGEPNDSRHRSPEGEDVIFMVASGWFDADYNDAVYGQSHIVEYEAVPEPTSIIVMALGGLLIRKR